MGVYYAATEFYRSWRTCPRGPGDPGVRATVCLQPVLDQAVPGNGYGHPGRSPGCLVDRRAVDIPDLDCPPQYRAAWFDRADHRVARAEDPQPIGLVFRQLIGDGGGRDSGAHDMDGISGIDISDVTAVL